MTELCLEITEILKYLPHRPPFLLIDRIVALEEKKSMTAIKNVTMNEPFFAGHFPQQPIMPGVLILEAMAQTATVFAFYSLPEEVKQENTIFFFAGIDKARFKRKVIPGDQLRLHIELLKIRHDIWKVAATATVDGELACSAELMSIRKDLDK
jgi:3-hydroxyacyl-[acyl-carrier-protein] dehydratase